MPLPLSVETAKAIAKLLKLELEHDANFVVALAKIHEKNPIFVADVLEFLDFARESRKQL